MTVTDVLTVCDARGVQLIIDGDELRARGRKGAVSDVLKQGIIQHKADLIELVYEREEAAAIEEEGRLSDIGRAFIKANKPRVTGADGVDPALAFIAARDDYKHSARGKRAEFRQARLQGRVLEYSRD